MTQHQKPQNAQGELARLLADRRWLVALCRKLLSSSADAEDLAQEAATRALQAEAMDDSEVASGSTREGRARRGRAWLAQAARRIASERRRSERHRRDREWRHAEGRPKDGRAVDPAEALARAEFRERIARLVLELPDAEREAVVLRFYEGLDYESMVESTGVRMEALRQRVSRGLGRIKERLTAEESEESEGNRPWQALALTVVAEAPAAKAGALKLVAAAVLLLCAGTAGTLWIGRTESTVNVTSRAEGERPVAEEAVHLAMLSDAAGNGRVTAMLPVEPEPDEEASAGNAPFVEVRLVDGATGAAASNQRWHVLRTGDFDLGQSPMPGTFFGGPLHPNPEPLASGVTGEDGIARFPRPDDDLVHLVTERTARFAFGSFPVEIGASAAVTPAVRLTEGYELFGTVVDDRGEAYPGAVFVGETYRGESVVLGSSGGDGSFRLERLARFPRSFKRVDPGEGPSGEIRATRSGATPIVLWPSRQAFERDEIEPTGVTFRRSDDEESVTITLWRSRLLRGVVLDEFSEPVPGARVVLMSRQDERVQADLPGPLGFANESIASLWEHAAVTGPGGTFELTLKHNDLGTQGAGHSVLGGHSVLASHRDLVAVAPPGRGRRGGTAVQGCEPLPLGEIREGLRLRLGATQAMRVRLFDPVGAVKQSSSSAPTAWLQLGDGDRARSSEVALAIAGDRAEFMLWRERLPRTEAGEVRGALLLPGYEPLPLDLSAAPSEVELTLHRRPTVPVTVRCTGCGADFVESLTFRVVHVDEASEPPSAADFARLEGWELRGEVVRGVTPGEQASLLARSGERAFLEITMHCVYGGLRSTCSIIELDELDSGAESGFEVEVAAPEWGTSTGASASHHPLILVPDSRLRVQLVDEDTGKTDFPWSFRATSTGKDFEGTVDHIPSPRQFIAHPGQAVLRFEARGHDPLVVGPVEFRPGGTVDLGRLVMARSDGTHVRLLRPDGEPATGPRLEARIPDVELAGRQLSSDARIEIGVAPDGQLLLDRGLGDVGSLIVRERGRPWSAGQVVTVKHGSEGRLFATVQPWQEVRFRLSGLKGPSLYASDGLLVSDAVHLCPAARTLREASSATHAFHTLRMPAGRWIVAPPPGSPIAFEPLEFELVARADPAEFATVDIEARPAQAR